MSCSVLHHVEVCVKDDRILHLLTKGFGFTPFAHRLTPAAAKLALRSGTSVFIVVKRNSLADQKSIESPGMYFHDGSAISNGIHNVHVCPDEENVKAEDSKQINNTYGKSNLVPVTKSEGFGTTNERDDWTVFCCEEAASHEIDSVFNVALVVKDVDAVTQRVRSRGGRVLKEPSDVSDAAGQVRYSIVTSCCGNIVHTLIDKSRYSGSFLPGFETIDNHEGKISIPDSVINLFRLSNTQYLQASEQNNVEPHNNSLMKSELFKDCTSGSPPITTYTDHVTYVCEVGKSNEILSWYEFCFGMKRFKTNRDENETEGFVLGGNIGLRLKVMEYWRCAETGLATPDPEGGDTSLKLVIAEPLPEVNTSHVDTFLRSHRGSGVQHIGLHTSEMVATVDFMAKNGVVFRKAPPVYYEEGIKLDEIKEAGHGEEVELFKELGILLDTEADVFTDVEQHLDKKGYLMQVFTGPLFDEDTFFLEVIQRQGARGFGAGNITALAKSIILHNERTRGTNLPPKS